MRIHLSAWNDAHHAMQLLWVLAVKFYLSGCRDIAEYKPTFNFFFTGVKPNA
jgi:hypothetical protein